MKLTKEMQMRKRKMVNKNITSENHRRKETHGNKKETYRKKTKNHKSKRQKWKKFNEHREDSSHYKKFLLGFIL